MQKDTKALCRKLVKHFDIMARHIHNPKSTKKDKTAATKGFWRIFDDLLELTMSPNWEYIEKHNQLYDEKKLSYDQFIHQQAYSPGAITPKLQDLADVAKQKVHEFCDMREITWAFVEEDPLRHVCFLATQAWGDEGELSKMPGFEIYKDSVLHEVIYYAAIMTEKKKFIDQAVTWRKKVQAINHMRYYVDSGEQLFSKSMRFLIDKYVLPCDVHHSNAELNNVKVERRKRWARQNCKGAFYVGRKHALFQDQADAVGFKLRWA